MKIALIGAGAIGGVTAAFLYKNNIDIKLITGSSKASEKINDNGIKITGVKGDYNIFLKAYDDISDTHETFDAIIIATKAFDLKSVAEKSLPYLNEDGVMISFQNGICFDILSPIVGKEYAIYTVITFASTKYDDGIYNITADGTFLIGCEDGIFNPKLTELKEILSKAFPTDISENFTADMFSKLIINSCIACGGVFTGNLLGEMLKRKKDREFFIAVVKEDIMLANAMGIKVPPFGGKLDYYKFVKGNSFLDNLRRHFMVRVIGIKYKKLKSSSLTSLERRNKTEADYLNGWISQKGREYNIKTPVNDLIVKYIDEIVAGKRKPKPENIVEIIDNI